mmetsp:Transcript_11658/g.28730  ORF Transcript_11658/g.28730 Transcript_11658/m.28730 type:complete len:548 (-) Transcript_11658:62-1705(-)
MPWVIPENGGMQLSRKSMFSKYKSIDGCKYFELQEKKAPKFKVRWPKKLQDLRPSYRIISRQIEQGKPSLKVAYSNNLEELRKGPWKFCTEKFERMMPKNASPANQWKWMEAFFTNLAISNGAEIGDDNENRDGKQKDEKDEDPSSEEKRMRFKNVMKNIRSVFKPKEKRHVKFPKQSRSTSPVIGRQRVHEAQKLNGGDSVQNKADLRRKEKKAINSLQNVKTPGAGARVSKTHSQASAMRISEENTDIPTPFKQTVTPEQLKNQNLPGPAETCDVRFTDEGDGEKDTKERRSKRRNSRKSQYASSKRRNSTGDLSDLVKKLASPIRVKTAFKNSGSVDIYHGHESEVQYQADENGDTPLKSLREGEKMNRGKTDEFVTKTDLQKYEHEISPRFNNTVRGSTLTQNDAFTGFEATGYGANSENEVSDFSPVVHRRKGALRRDSHEISRQFAHGQKGDQHARQEIPQNVGLSIALDGHIPFCFFIIFTAATFLLMRELSIFSFILCTTIICLILYSVTVLGYPFAMYVYLRVGAIKGVIRYGGEIAS